MIINYCCTGCRIDKSKYYRKSKDILEEIECPECGAVMERLLGSPRSKSTQIIDNGLQARQVEVSSDVVEQEREKLFKED